MVVKWTGCVLREGPIVPEGSGALHVGCALQMWVLRRHNGASCWELMIQIRNVSREPGGVTGGAVTPDGL